MKWNLLYDQHLKYLLGYPQINSFEKIKVLIKLNLILHDNDRKSNKKMDQGL